MARDSSAPGASASLAEGFVWVRADTFGSLLGGVGLCLWLWVASYVGHGEDLWPGWGLPLGMLLLTGACAALRQRDYHLASGLFVANLLTGAVVLVLSQPGDAFGLFLFIPVVLIAGALRGPRATFLTALLASAALPIANPTTDSGAPSSALLGALALVWLAALTTWATSRNLYTALHWAWTDSEASLRNLQEAQRYQGELAAALRQLEEANYRLERANYALGLARAEADEARQLKAQFAAHVSHELRTPINLVVGFAELMLNNPETYGDTPLPSSYAADLTAIHRSARHLRGLIDDILDLSQIDAGAMPVLKELTDVGALVHEAVATARQLLDRKGLTVRVAIDPDLPLLSLDRLRIRQVLLNLLSNAVRFTERGGVSICVSRRGPQGGEEQVVVEVADTGVGIRPGDLAKLFEPFHQVGSSPTRGPGGTGLGLAISRRFVELHGGRIWATSRGTPGEGTTFGFALPVEAEAPPIGPGDHGSRRWQLPSAPPAPTVVVLDDDPAIVGLFQRHLEGYRVAGAATRGEALALAARLRAHAIVTDLPGDGASEVWQRGWSQAAREQGIRVVGCPMPSGRRSARLLGLVDYLVKPVTGEVLLESLRLVAPAARTVLVVDDEPQMVRLLCGMLRTAGAQYQPLVAYSGEQALESMRRLAPDLVLLDILMPRVGGLAVLEMMRADPELARVPVIAVSARGAVEAISPSTARTLVVIGDEPFSISRLLGLTKTIFDGLPPVEAEGRPSEPGPPGEPGASAASG